LELVAKSNRCAVYKDFAHSPSKLKATLEAVRTQYPDRTLIACMELHTFSSLSAQFLPEYARTMNCADLPVVFFDPHALAHKKLPPLSEEQIYTAFHCPNLEVLSNTNSLINNLLHKHENKTVFLLMSSGNFGGVDIQEIANKIVLLQTQEENDI
jgi:UDP-N-acetylmuramate: L-alanyl-gamma-D-glutamyl-meso-diaminopimelate ligase